MNEKVFDILNDIDVVQESSFDTQLAVLGACDDAYTKYCTFAESFEGDASELDFYTEGAVADEMKKMKKDGESGVVTVLAALPRFIAALIKVITGKTKDAEANLDKAEKNKGKIAKVVDGILSEQDEKKQESMLAKIGKIIGNTMTLTVCATGVAGLVMSVKPREVEGANGEKGKKAVATGVETIGNGPLSRPIPVDVCITSDGKVAMTKEFIERADDLEAKINKIVKTNDPDKIPTEELNKMANELTNMYFFKKKYDGKDAKEMGLTGFKGFLKRFSNYLVNIKDYTNKLGHAAKEKAGDKKIAGAAATAFDHVIRGFGAFVTGILYALGLIVSAIASLIAVPVSLIAGSAVAVKETVSKNPIDKKLEKEDEAVNKVDKEKKTADFVNGLKKTEDEVDDKDEDADEQTEDVKTESATIEVDPAVSSWYTR